jgi:hypothetical protein
MDRTRDELLPGAALARDEHRQVVPLEPLNLLDNSRHRGAGGQKSWQQWLQGAVDLRADRRIGPVERRTKGITLAGHGDDHPQSPHHRMSQRTR